MDDASKPNVEQAVPFFGVASMDASLAFYVEGLGFRIARKWMDEGKLRWCWLELGGAALMLQEFRTGGHDSWKPDAKVGVGVSVNFMCRDALAIYREAGGRGVAAARKPFVGNGMWVVEFGDPDGYKLYFESPTDAPEESELPGE